ncbi:hypothetical protein LSTR_LSTR017080 [Laodelphax striatellus]|uniref:Uncharacterized protein n=1 Tax=Laodelphax striatellus TaxID=195883 RepID=A0A482XCN4_LAOST|nr:hypothetical protein LSTR_LSTR017080 [Laodelphax striatellus]
MTGNLLHKLAIDSEKPSVYRARKLTLAFPRSGKSRRALGKCVGNLVRSLTPQPVAPGNLFSAFSQSEGEGVIQVAVSVTERED